MVDAPVGSRSPDRVLGRALAGTIGLFACTMFVASGLLFLVQPMFARLVLPRLGGSPSVWNTCVLFFQTMLLLGYVYAHLATKKLGIRRQTRMHAVVLLFPLLFLPLTAGTSVPEGSESPVAWLLRTMGMTVGVPFFALSTTAPVLQRWFATFPLSSARDPYFLYSASNLGSMVALLGYPFGVEPLLGVRHQTLVWTLGYVAFVGLALACMWMTCRFGHEPPVPTASSAPVTAPPVTPRQRVTWILFSFAPSSMMLGVTMHISTDLAAVPLLWVVPLTIYLLTFVLAFSRRVRRPHTWSAWAAPPLAVASVLTILLNAQQWWFIPLHLVTFFSCAMVCHRALADARPVVSHLTEFYIWISAGGMLGGVFNTLIAPHIFATVFEYPLVLGLMTFLMPAGTLRTHAVPRLVLVTASALLFGSLGAWLFASPSAEVSRFLAAVALGVSVPLGFATGSAVFRAVVALFVLAIAVGPSAAGDTVLYTGRSFFGVLKVVEARDHSHRVLRHGSTMHGWQELSADARCEPSAYYHRSGPIGQVLQRMGTRVTDAAVVGLGTGALACYAVSGQRWTFYEIDPLVEKIAKDARFFTQLQNSQGAVDIVIGDGRIALQRAREGQYDVIIVDAFSSDAIPVHLLTEEAMRLYVSRLKPHGVLAIHISNRYLRLEPVVADIARRQWLTVLSNPDDAPIPAADISKGRTVAHWMAIARDSVDLQRISELPGWRLPSIASRALLWTDDYSNIVRVMKAR